MNSPDSSPLGFIQNPTPWLREVVSTQEKLLPESDFAAMLVTIRRLYEKYRTALQSAAPGAERARLLHRMMDQAMATADGIQTSCAPGCCGCCHAEVEITPDEAAVLAARVREGVIVDRTRMELQAARPRLSSEWARFFAPENRCVFLGEDRKCQVYESRPAACRRLLMTSPAEACSTQGAMVMPVRVLLAEVLLSAALDVASGRYASLPRLLTEELTRSG